LVKNNGWIENVRGVAGAVACNIREFQHQEATILRSVRCLKHRKFALLLKAWLKNLTQRRKERKTDIESAIS
jgi:hypothetical protein